MTRKTRATKAELLMQLAEMKATADRIRQAKTYAQALCRLMNINPAGVEIVCAITDGKCRNNLDALSKWTRHQLEERSFEDDLTFEPFPMQVLLKRLNRYLTALEAANS